MKTVLELLSDAAKKFPDSIYISEKTDNGWDSKTYKEVDIESKYLASGLLDLGLNKSDKIAILSEGRLGWVIGEYACLQIGGTAVPLSIKLSPDELLFRLNHSDSKAIFISKHNFEKLGEVFNKLDYKDFKIIYLDDYDTAKVYSEKYKIDINKNIVLFNDILTKGKELYKNNSIQLDVLRKGILEDDVVTISYTSGTTGNPKGIMLTHLNYYSNSKDAYDYFGLDDGLKTLIILPLDHSFAHTVGIYISCFCALSIYFADSRNGGMNMIKNIPSNLKEVKPDLLLTVPALTGNFIKNIKANIEKKGGIGKKIFDAGLKAGAILFGDAYNKPVGLKRILLFPKYKLADKLVFSKIRQFFGGNIKFFVGGGALLDIKQQKFFYSIGIPVYQGYGLTEATPIISTNKKGMHKMGTSGRIINNVTCNIIKEGKILEKGEKGEIVIKGNNVMKGYYKNESATSETIIDNWLYTGDMGYFDEDDFLMVTGREKALLISEDGEKYSPEEIEEAIANSSEIVNQVMLYNDHKKYTTALITLEESKVKSLIDSGKYSNPEEILDYIKTEFFAFDSTEEYKGVFQKKWIPSVFYIVPKTFNEEDGMINSTLKMVRFKITEVYMELIEKMYTSGHNTIKSENNLRIIEDWMKK